MNDKEYYYSINWTQVYDTWIPSNQWIDDAVSIIVESALESSDYKEAQSVIDKIKGL